MVFFAVCGAIIAFILFFHTRVFTSNELIIHVTSDMHAGSKKTRDYSDERPGNIVYPKEWKEYYTKFLNKPGDVYITLGDNIQTDSEKDTKKYPLIRALDEKYAQGKIVLHVVGNHDNRDKFELLSPQKYQAVDTGNWRIIIVNTEENPAGGGGISETQFAWIREQVATEKNVLIGMHRPLFSEEDLTLPTNDYSLKLLEIVKAHPNIKYVLFGHYHVLHNEVRTFPEYNDTKFIYVQAMTLKGFKGNFLTLKLEK